MNRKIQIFALTVVLVLCGSMAVFAADNVGQTVTFQVAAINEIAISGNPGAMIINTATAGLEPDAVTNALTTYSITTNGTSKKITGVLDSAMPANVVLQVTMAAPTWATSISEATLTGSAVDVVTGITQSVAAAKIITYKLSATVLAGVVASSTRVVTLTVTN